MTLRPHGYSTACSRSRSSSSPKPSKSTTFCFVPASSSSTDASTVAGGGAAAGARPSPLPWSQPSPLPAARSREPRVARSLECPSTVSTRLRPAGNAAVKGWPAISSAVLCPPCPTSSSRTSRASLPVFLRSSWRLCARPLLPPRRPCLRVSFARLGLASNLQLFVKKGPVAGCRLSGVTRSLSFGNFHRNVDILEGIVPWSTAYTP